MLVYSLPMISGEKCLVLFFMPGARLLFQNKEPSIEDLDVDYSFFDEHIWPILANRIPAFESLKVSVSAQQAAGLYFSVSALCVHLADSRTLFLFVLALYVCLAGSGTLFFCLGIVCPPGRQQNFIFLSWHCVSTWQAAELYFSVLVLRVCQAGSGMFVFCRSIEFLGNSGQGFCFCCKV